jgi:hypothetical protein
MCSVHFSWEYVFLDKQAWRVHAVKYISQSPTWGGATLRSRTKKSSLQFDRVGPDPELFFFHFL